MRGSENKTGMKSENSITGVAHLSWGRVPGAVKGEIDG